MRNLDRHRESGPDQPRRPAGVRRARRLINAALRRFAQARSGNIAVMFALTLPVLILAAGGVMDLSSIVDTKTHLQDATDAASLVASAETAQNPNTAESKLMTDAGAMLASDFNGATITEFHVCAPIQNDCVSHAGVALTPNTVSITTTALAPCYLGRFVPGVCTGVNSSKSLYVTSTTTIGFAKTLQINLLLDSSGSMIVGATPQDITTITNWTSAHWSQVKPLGGSDNPPCAFACHDEGDSTTGSTSTSDMAQGLQNAKTAGATTRFQVMTAAANDLVNHIQTEVTSNQQLSRNTYLFNVASFDTTVHFEWMSGLGPGAAGQNLSYSDALTAIGRIYPGLDTDIGTAMSTAIAALGPNGNGASAASPLKLLILVTDGLQSSRDANWACNASGYDSYWNFSPTCYGGYATTINTSQCATLKNSGIVLAVLETSYVPLTGQSPNVQPYEKTVRHVIYPTGPSSPSTVSAALQACASTGYYFQANNASDIATGFTTLADNFIASVARVQQ